MSAEQKVRGRRNRRMVMWGAAAVIVAAAAVALRPRPLEVDAVPVARQSFDVTVDEDGRTRLAERYVVSAPLTGRATRIELHEGDAVRAGQVLVHLQPASSPLLDPRSRAEASARLAAALAGLQQTQSAVVRAREAQRLAGVERDRARTLADAGVMAAQQRDRVEFEATSRAEEYTAAVLGERIAAHQVSLARATLARIDVAPASGARADEELELTAPTDGRVLRVLHESEGVVAAGTPLLELGDPNTLEVVADLLTQDAVRIREGAPVELTRWGGDQPLRGHVARLEPAAATRVSALGVEEQRVNVVIHFDDPSTAAKLGDGYYVEARILVHAAKDVLAVPASALFRRGEDWAVFRIVDGEARTATVKLGARGVQLAEVISGLSEGDQVLTYPGESVRDGVRVVVR